MVSSIIRKINIVNLFLVLCVVSRVKCGWIDVDTPEDKYTTKSFVDGSTYQLVMSDEFNVPHRSFKDGDDPTWTALDKSDDDSNAAGGGSLHFYNSSYVTTTEDGMLQITSAIGKTEWDHYNPIKKKFKHITKNFKSGMLQSWNKFCFTGGIVELDIILPGEPHIGGLWPAVWMLGNLGRSTYEASTNNIWPWSYNTCDRELQPAQMLSKCNEQNHYGMNKHQGRGATEIDLLEVNTGAPGMLDNTDPPIELPYIDMTLQVAPGIPYNRPTPGYQPIKKTKLTESGHIQTVGQNWYDGLEFYGNTSLNNFFYGTYLGKTKPEEPVQRTEKQAFQADAVGAMHQATTSHFRRKHSFRLEWQPGPGGRLDWFTKAYKKNNTMNCSVEGDGNGQDWVKALTIKGESLEDVMGSQIPNEPSYLIMNVAISSSWGFPYSLPPWCKPCYDCNDPTCHCAFNPGFCEMLKQNTTMSIDFIRVYQSHNASAHVGNNHTVGCDPVEYPTKEWIKGHAHLYSRRPPFSYNDKGPLRKVKRGGGPCTTDQDCGAGEIGIVPEDPNEEKQTTRFASDQARKLDNNSTSSSTTKKSQFVGGRGKCVPNSELGLFSNSLFSSTSGHGDDDDQVSNSLKVCKCNEGYTGPHCLSIDHKDDQKGAYELSARTNLFQVIATPFIPPLLSFALVCLCFVFLIVLLFAVNSKKKEFSY